MNSCTHCGDDTQPEEVDAFGHCQTCEDYFRSEQARSVAWAKMTDAERGAVIRQVLRVNG